MTERPPLNQLPDGKTFRAYYYLKEELAAFCRENRLPASGSKAALADRVARFLDGEALPAPSSGRRKAVSSGPITRESRIEENFVCSEAHRAFFPAKPFPRPSPAGNIKSACPAPIAATPPT